MIKLSRNPLRWMLTLALMPLMPYLVLLVANFGSESAEKTWSLAMPGLMENPWMFMVMLGLGPAMVIGMLIHLVFSPTFAKSHCDAVNTCKANHS